jgi:hypothetical protein
MDWKEFVKDEILLSEKAKTYFSEAQTQKRRRKNFFQKKFNGEWN